MKNNYTLWHTVYTIPAIIANMPNTLSSKKLVTSLVAMMSINYIACLVYNDNLTMTDKRDVYLLIITALTALAGVHGFLQAKTDLKTLAEKGVKKNDTTE